MASVETSTRNEDIVAAIRSGQSLQAVGDAYGLSRERVRQIVNTMTGNGTIAVRGYSAHKSAAVRAADADIDRIIARLRSGERTADVASCYRVSVSQLTVAVNNAGYRISTLRHPDRWAWLPAAQALIDQRVSYDQIESRLGLTAGHVSNAVQTGRLIRRRRKHERTWVFDEDDARRRVQSGESIASIARSINVPPATVQQRLRVRR